MKIIILILLSFHLAQAKKFVIIDENGQPVRQKHLPKDAAENSASEFDSGARMDLPDYSGNGCRSGTVSSTLSPDNKTLSVLFDDMSTLAAAGVTSRKVCRVRIPIRVSPGFQVAIVKSDLRGFASLPESTRASVKTVHSLSIKGAGRYKDIDRKPFTREAVIEGPSDDEIYMGEHIETEQVWSPCGVEFGVNMGVTITVSNGSSPTEALAIVDSIDFHTADRGVQYSLNWRRCGEPIKAGHKIK